MQDLEVLFDIFEVALEEINSQPDLVINDWLQAIAILSKIKAHAIGEPVPCGSSVALWWS